MVHGYFIYDCPLMSLIFSSVFQFIFPFLLPLSLFFLLSPFSHFSLFSFTSLFLSDIHSFYTFEWSFIWLALPPFSSCIEIHINGFNCFRSVQMRLYTMHKREFVMVFIIFFASLGLALFVGLAGKMQNEMFSPRFSCFNFLRLLSLFLSLL